MASRSDFCGLSGLREFLYGFGLVPPNATPRVRFDAGDWTKTPRRFAGRRG